MNALNKKMKKTKTIKVYEKSSDNYMLSIRN